MVVVGVVAGVGGRAVVVAVVVFPSCKQVGSTGFVAVVIVPVAVGVGVIRRERWHTLLSAALFVEFLWSLSVCRRFSMGRGLLLFL